MKRILILGATLAVGVPGVLAKRELPGIQPGELAVLQARYKAVAAENKKLEKEIEKELKDAAAVKILLVKKRFRPKQLSYLRFLTMLEEDLRLLASPVDPVGEELDVPEFGVQERRRVETLREKIREAERKRIRSELKEGRGMHGDEKIEKGISRHEMSLDSLYDRKAGKLERSIAKAEREIDRAQRARAYDEKKIEALEGQIDEWRGRLEIMHRFVYGFAAGAGFEGKENLDEATASGKFRAELAAERERVLKVLRGEKPMGGEGKKKGGLVGGSFVYSSNLGVILDVSGSMTSHIEPLKKEIAKTFAAPRYGEVPGCRLSGQVYSGLTLAALTPSKADTMTVMEDLIVVHGVDTVYWFCDLRDGFDFAGLRRLRALLMRGGTAFHVKSMDRRPERELKPLITDFQK